MAVVSFRRDELEVLVGKKLSRNVLENRAPMMGCDFEGMNEGEVEYEIFPDRPDLLSVEGFARSLRYFLGVSRGLEGYEAKEGEVELIVDDSVESVRPCVAAGVVRDVELDEDVLRSLMQVQEKIHATFGRERRKVSIGIHDISDVKPPFTYKAVEPQSIEFVPLQSQEKMDLREIGEKHPKGEYVKIIEKNDRWPVIVDDNGGVLSFPPVINGVLTQLTRDTKDIFIDVTGTDQKAVEQALNLIATELAERGGKVEKVKVKDKKLPDLSPEEMEVNLDYVNRILDIDITEGEFAELVGGMGFGYSDGKVLVPPYRVDVMHPIDIAEDVAISHGYENFEPHIPHVRGIGDPDKFREFEDKIRELFVGFGYQEVITSILTNKEKQFESMERKIEDVVEAKKPLSEKQSVCRKYVLPELMEVLKQNKHRSYPQRIFEVGDVLKLDEDAETGAKNIKKLAGVLSDERVNYTDIASVLVSIFRILDLDYKLDKTKESFYIDGRAANIVLEGEVIGLMGEIHPQVLENWELEKPVVAFEINANKLIEKYDS